MTLAGVQPALAQSKPPSRYDVFDVGEIPIPPGSGWHDLRYTAFAINENNSVAGWVELRISAFNGQFHATYWTPNNEHGFSAFTLYDLTELAGLDASCDTGLCVGQAMDINDDDIVVGSQIPDLAVPAQPFVWVLSTNDDPGGLQTFNLGNLLSNPDDGGGVAHGITDTFPAKIVGEVHDETGLSPPSCTFALFAFEATFPPGASTMTRIGSTSVGAVALDINEATTQRAVGQFRDLCPGSTGGCAVTDDASRWVLPSGTSQLLPEPLYVDSIARATNNANQSCGNQGEIDFCGPVATFWSVNGANATPIGDTSVTPQMPEGAQTLAHGMSPADGGESGNARVNVVGENTVDSIALLWHRDVNLQWSGYDLNYRVLPACGLQLRVAFDTNSNGWVVGRAADDFGNVRGFVLRPSVCPAEYTGDCLVDGADLGALLGAWGPADPNSYVTQFDLTQDGIVDGADLGALLGAWGACPSSCITCSSGFAMASSPSEGSTWNAALETGLAILGFASVDEFNEWQMQAEEESASAALAQLAVILIASDWGGNEK
ncbi:MAG: hypothetical protein JNM94_01055 [Phycisphaerae bacterium]|nr:hypothetical protein [Phycisphaerae bacterium]